MRYSYCPDCGTKLVMKHAGDDGDVPYCEKCQNYWFDGFPTCVIVLTYNEYGEIALCRQDYLSSKYMTITSGYMTPGESAEEAALREVKEELGLDVTDLHYEKSYWFGRKGILMLGFTAFCKKQDFKRSEEVDDAFWIEAEKAGELMFPDGPGNASHGLLKIYLARKNNA